MDGEFWRGKRVFVTGHTGFKGSWLCVLLDYLGANVAGYSKGVPTYPSLYKTINLEKKITSYSGDVRDYSLLESRISEFLPEIIFHLAAQPLVKYSYDNPIETYSTNVMGTVNILEAVRKTNTVSAVVNVTSDKCYENKEWFWGYRENEEMGGHDPYSNSKGCSELVTSSYRKSYFNQRDYPIHGIALASARAGNVIGGGDWAMDRLIPDILRAFQSKQTVEIRNPSAIRPWQHVLEPLSGYILLAEKLLTHDGQYAEAWNFGPDDSGAKEVVSIVEFMAKTWGEGASWKTVGADIHHEAKYLKLDCSKAKADLDWRPRWSIEKTLTHIVDWHKSFMDDQDMMSLTLNEISEYIES